MAIANTMPVASNIQTNNTLPITNEFVAFNATWTDADLNDLKGYIFSSNFNGTWANETPISFGGTTNYSNYSKQVPSTYGEYQWRIYANDSDGAWNDTEIQYITIISNSSEWPMFHHNIVHTGHTSSASPTINNTRWIFITQGSAQSSPAIVNGVVYIGSNDNRTYALNASTGAHIWNFSTKNSVISSPAVANNIVYVGSYDNNTYALNASTGAHIWNFSTNGSIDSSPAVVNAIMYVGSRDKKIYALNASTGAHIWNFTTGNSIIYSSPTIAKGISYIGSNDGKTYALNASTGAHIWNFSPSSTGVVPTTIVFNDVAYTASNNLYALNASTGAHIWNYSAASGSIESSPAIDNGVVYLGDLSNMLNMVNATSGASIRNVTVADMIDFSSPAIANSIIYFGDISGKFYAINASNGVNVWNYTSGNQQIISSPAIADGVVYVGADNGIIYAFGSNRAPTATNIILNSTDPQNRTNGTLSGFWTFSEQDYNDTQQLNETTWYNNSVEVTQFRNITSIGRNATKNQNWTFSVRVYDGEDWSNWSNSSTITIQNTAPTQSTPIINSSMGLNKTNETLYCFNQSTADIDGDAISNKIRWLNNSAAIIALENLTSISHGNTTKNENWTCEITPFDGTAYGTALNSSILTIANLAPTATNIILNSSMKLNKTNETLQGFWTFSDADGDTQQNNETMWYNNSVEIVSLRNDIDGDTITNRIRWLNNSIAVASLENQTSIGHGNTTKLQNWTCEVTPYDGTDHGTALNSSILTIANSISATSNVTTYPTLAYKNNTLNCSAVYNDADNDIGTVYFSWYKNNARQNSYTTSLVAGNGAGGYAEGNVTSAMFNYPGHLAVDSAGNTLYLTDYFNAKVRKVNLTTNTTSLISGGFVGSWGIVLFNDTTLYVSDWDNCTIQKINLAMNATSTVAGNGTCGYAEGTGSSAMFNNPSGLAVNSNGTFLYVADYSNNRIRRIDLTTNTTSLIAGNGTAGYTEGVGNQTKFNNPYAATISPDNHYLYISDSGSHRIRRIDLTTNTTSLIAGNGTRGYLEGTGINAMLNGPDQTSMNSEGTMLYFIEPSGNRVRAINLTTNTTLLVAGNGTPDYLEGSFINVMVSGEGLVSNPSGTKLYISDSNNNRIRVINLNNSYDATVANVTSGTLAWTNIFVPSSALTKNDNWTCSAIAYDGTIFSNWVNSSSVMINNSAPILNSSISAQNWSEGGSATINLSLYFTDIDNDNLIYNSTMPSDITISINQTSKIAALTAVGSWYGENFITFNATDGSLNATSNNITLTLSNIIRCGDGIKEGSEECDDGNTVSGDGCSASCAIEGSGGGGSGGGGGGVTPPAQPTQPPPEQPPQPTPEEQPPELPPEQPPQVEFPETITQPQTIIIAGATSTINTVPCFNYTENKTLALKQSNITKAMNIPKGYSVLINPFSPDCAKGSLTLTFNIPNNYVDVNALKCKGDECSPAIIEETTKLKCGGKIVKEFRRNTSYLEPILMPINITKTDMIIKYEKDTIESGKYKIKFLNEINQKVSISMPSEAVREPENTNLKIIATPLIVTFENRTAINAVISLPYILGKNIENDSIAIYIKINETWNHIGGDINYEENKITATMNNLEEFLDENNQATIAVMGIICLYCEKSELNKVYDPKTSREAVILVHGFERSPERFNDIINDIKLTRQPWQTWTFAYPSSKTIEENGKQFAELLELNINEYDNLYFVAHSLGGLITQQALYYGYEHNYSFVNKARKAVLIASPNKGSISEGVYRNLYNFLMNSKTAELFNIKGAVVKELVYGKAIPEVPGMEYKVIAGTKSYGFVKITKSNDGLVTVESAQTVGGKIINNSCENYWAINVTHTDILDNIESKQIIERIIAEEVAKVVGSGKSLLGSNQYIELNIPECSYEDTYVIVGKEIKEEKLPDITGCSCGNGYCGLDETAASCPQDCARIISKENIELIALLALAVVLLMSLMAALTALYKKIRRHKIGRPLRYTLLTLITAGAAIYLAKSYFVDDKYQFLGNAVAMILALAVFFILFFFSSKLLNLILKHTRIKQAKIPIKAKPKLQHKLLPDFKNLIKVLHENLAIRLRNYENKRKLLKSLKEKKLQELRAKKELERKRRAAEQEKVRLLKEQERIRKLEEQERLKKLEEERKKRELEEKERLKTFKEIEKQRILEDIRKLKAIKTKVSDAAILLKENVNKAKQLYLEILENYKKLAAGKRKDVYNEVIGLYDKLKEAARLEKYIKNTLNAVIDKKLTIDQLKSALRQKGWNKDAIEAALAAAKQEFYRERIKEVTDKIEAAKKEYCKPIYNNIIDVYAYLGLDDLFEAKRLYLRTLELYARSPSYVQAEVYNDLQKLYRLLFKRGMGNAK
ncbi:PQQ-binding-like beta-propeller repeat protein [Candidatus Woesearchaeota archaeon]|nr:PQQ-binding-like beta-propeller repeat protein [Candidatus Woesearchaeota archaeon]